VERTSVSGFPADDATSVFGASTDSTTEPGRLSSTEGVAGRQGKMGVFTGKTVYWLEDVAAVKAAEHRYGPGGGLLTGYSSRAHFSQ
jgi:hypothetical protein